MARNWIALIGSGQIGGALALPLIGLKELGDVVLFGIDGRRPAGQLRSILFRHPGRGILKPTSPASTPYEGLEGASVCIVTAGVPRKPGANDDLLQHQSQGTWSRSAPASRNTR